MASATTKIHGIIIWKKEANSATKLLEAVDLSSVGFFQRHTVQEFMFFTSQTLVGRTAPGQRQTVAIQERNALVHCFVRHDSVAATIFTDNSYPTRVGFTLLNKALDDYDSNKNTPGQGKAKLDETLRLYQDPKKADPMMRVQSELDETKIILHNTISSVLERGERLDNLVEKSDQLSRASKTFYKSAKDTNSCCT